MSAAVAAARRASLTESHGGVCARGRARDAYTAWTRGGGGDNGTRWRCAAVVRCAISALRRGTGTHGQSQPSGAESGVRVRCSRCASVCRRPRSRRARAAAQSPPPALTIRVEHNIIPTRYTRIDVFNIRRLNAPSAARALCRHPRHRPWRATLCRPSACSPLTLRQQSSSSSLPSYRVSRKTGSTRSQHFPRRGVRGTKIFWIFERTKRIDKRKSGGGEIPYGFKW